MLLSLLTFAAQPQAPEPHIDCSYNLEAMLALGRDAFDQDLNGGWRELGNREGCTEVAAELIREWRQQKTRRQLCSVLA